MGTGISLALWTPRKDTKGVPTSNGTILVSYLDVRCNEILIDVVLEHQLLVKSTLLIVVMQA